MGHSIKGFADVQIYDVCLQRRINDLVQEINICCNVEQFLVQPNRHGFMSLLIQLIIIFYYKLSIQGSLICWIIMRWGDSALLKLNHQL